MLGNGMGPLISQSLDHFLSDVDDFRRIDLGVGMFWDFIPGIFKYPHT